MTTTTITLAPFIIKSLQWLLALLLIDYTAVTIATLIDLKSGIKKCHRLNIPCTSGGYRRTIDKLSRYYTTLMSLTTIDAMLTATAMLLQSTAGWNIPAFPLFTTIGAIAMTLIEAKSVMENTQQKSDYTTTLKSINELLENPDLKNLAEHIKKMVKDSA